MAYLFDTDAVSEAIRPRRLSAYVDWLGTIPRSEQFVSAMTVGELYRGALESSRPAELIAVIEGELLHRLTVHAFDTATARVFGELSARLRRAGTPLEDADLQIAATAVHHGLELVTGNIRHFSRVPGLVINPVLAEARR